MNKWVKIAAGAGLIWYGVLRGAQALVVGIRDYYISGVDIANRTVKVTLNVFIKNPLFVGLKLNSISGEVYMQGIGVGSVDMQYNYFLSGRSTHVIPITVELNAHGMTEALLANIQTGDIKTLSASFDGKLYIGKYNVGVPVRLGVNYDDIVKTK